MPIVQLLYFSRLRLDADQHLLDLDLGRWHDHNRDHEIATILTVRGSMCVQLFEGRDPEMDKLFTRISDDPRHDKVTVLKRSWVARGQLQEPGLRATDLSEDSDLFASAYERVAGSTGSMVNALVQAMVGLHATAPRLP